jgi:NAD(P)-dependent dehydrogenase (short-subunit alcohol dehydrogenase family)
MVHFAALNAPYGRLAMTQQQTGRITLVTGASRGIGRAVALEVARRGGDVVALARTQGALEELDDAVRALGRSASLVPVDLKDFDALDRLADVVAQRWGRLDGLAAVGGMLGPLSPIRDIAPKDWEEALAVDLTANFRLLRAFDRLLRASKAGRAVLVSSGAAARPRAFWAPYAAAKAGVDALAKSYAAEVGAFGVKVNVVNPGPTRTAMRAKAMPGEDPSKLPPPEAPARLIVDLLSPEETRTGERLDFRDVSGV